MKHLNFNMYSTVITPANFQCSAEATFLDGLGGSTPGTESEPSMESMTNIFPHTYCKLSNALKELGYK
jgi:hypothetical protein